MHRVHSEPLAYHIQSLSQDPFIHGNKKDRSSFLPVLLHELLQDDVNSSRTLGHTHSNPIPLVAEVHEAERCVVYKMLLSLSSLVISLSSSLLH